MRGEGYFGSNVVYEYGAHGLEGYSVEGWLQKNKTLCLFSAIDDDTTNNLIGQLLYADKQGWQEIDLLINSPGGTVSGLFSILDCMDNISTKVNTRCIGQASSAAAVLLACGHKRTATKRARIMLHDIASGSRGTYRDQEIQHKELTKARAELVDTIFSRCKLENRAEVIEKLMNRDFFMSADEAIEFGLIDSIYTKK